MSDRQADPRTLHARFLAQKPLVEDLPEKLRAVARACRAGEQEFMCQWGRDNLSEDDWSRIQAAEAEEERRKAELLEMAAICQRRDEAALQTIYPGHFAFYEMVASPPAFEEQPVDAVVIIGISGNLERKAKKVLERGMAREALRVQYGGPSLRDYSPNKYACRRNTDNFFYGYYTPEIEQRMDTPRPQLDRLRNTRFIQSARRRDTAVSIARDWLIARQHRSVRFIVTGQSAWPQYALLFEQLLSDFDTFIDTNFDDRLPRDSSFIKAMCGAKRRSTLWIDYAFYVMTLVGESPRVPGTVATALSS